jgi:putative ABC transport system permease protein
MIAILGIVVGMVLIALAALGLLFLGLWGGEVLVNVLNLGRASRFVLVMVKSLRRNPLRTSLTYLAAFVLVAVVTIIWSALYVLDHLVQTKARDIKVVVSERWQANSLMPFAYARPLCEGGADPSSSRSARPQDAMTWQFYLGTLAPGKQDRENLVFFIALEPRKAVTLMERILDDVPQESHMRTGPRLTQAKDFLLAVERMEKDKRGVILGRKQLKMFNKRVGERMKVTGINFKDLDLEVEIVGSFPEGRYDDTAIMNRDYLNGALDVYPKAHGGNRHPRADRSLNLVVLQVADMDSYQRVTEQIDSCGQFKDPAVKCETLAAYAVTQLESFRDIVWAMRWLLAPAILVTLTLIIANGISISVRERRSEIAVLKVLGYRPAQVLVIILGEAALLGALSGFLSAVVVYQTINRLMDNSDAILPVYIPDAALWWGPAVGILTALAGSIMPAWAACRVQVVAVFSRVT